MVNWSWVCHNHVLESLWIRLAVDQVVATDAVVYRFG